MSSLSVMRAFRISDERVVKGDVGIEIEVEGTNLLEVGKYWKRVGDPSLINGMEYVLKVPLPLSEVRKSLTSFARSCTLNQSEHKDTVRAGVHVHLNMQDMSVLHLYNLITLYLVFEMVLVDYCGEGRQGNLFCLRSKDNDYLAHLLASSAKNMSVRNFRNDGIRSCSMNLNSLHLFGSLEFRALRTPVGKGSMKRIYDWVLILNKLKEACKEFDSPMSVVESFSGMGGVELLKSVMGEMYDLLPKEDMDKKLMIGMRSAQDVAYSSDWAWLKEDWVYNPFRQAG